MWRLGAPRMSSATEARLPSEVEQLGRERRGLALAVADVGWFNNENLFREIDGDSVSVLLLKCFDYVNGYRRGLYPWSNACRLKQCGDVTWERQHVLPSGWMKRFPRLGMRPSHGRCAGGGTCSPAVGGGDW